ncbi:MAG TPA: HlyC/CorC family transporter [Clostridiales bacterium]|nr:HlyC/CorC family transporter [Clostridiales bacterium]
MDSDSLLLYCGLLVLILGGGYFACAETAFASSNNIRIKNRAEKGDRRAKDALYVLDNFDKALSTMLVGNNIMNIGTASLATLLVTRLWGAGAVVYSTIVTTIVVFFICEMFPKSFAREHPESTALMLAGSLRFVMKILAPVTYVFSWAGNYFSKLFTKTDSPSVTEEELYDIIESIAEDGKIQATDSKLLVSALKFDDITAQEVLTSRVSVVGVEVDSTYPEILDIIKKHKYSRLPVYRETLDDILGILNVRRFIKSYLQYGDTIPITELMDEPYFVHKRKRIDDLLDEMSAQRLHMAVVRDDFGGTMGIVTVEDILEELVGEIWDETDEVREEFKSIGGRRYEVSGDYDILDAFEQMGYQGELPWEEQEHKTVSAWAQEELGCIPKEGQTFQYGQIHATVLQVSQKRRITKVLLELKEPEVAAD